jgi:hypothetical protein
MSELPLQPRAATASVNVGTVEGIESRGRLFGTGIDNEAAIRGLVSDVQHVAPEFMRRLASDPAVLEDTVNRSHMQRTAILPLLMLVHGRTADARRFVEDELRELPSKGPYRDFYRVFAERVLAMFDGQDHPPGQ